MNVLSTNIRGLGRIDKGEWISNIRVSNEVAFVMLQESQFASLQGVDVGRFWGRGAFEYDFVDATGRSGGLLSLWDQKIFHKSSIQKSRYFLAVHGFIKGSGMKIVLVNVYAPQKNAEKRLLWRELERLVQHDDAYWIVGGDFNCVRDSSERKNTNFNAALSKKFNDFLDKVELHEYGLKGRNFRWVSSNKCSRIDRIFVSLNFLNDWPMAEYRALARDKSDHSPLILKVEYRNYGPKPFRFFNSWLDRSGFDEVIKEAVKSFREFGAYDVSLLRKFKHIRNCILEWKKEKITLEQDEFRSILVDLEELDKVVENRDLLEEEQWVFYEGKMRIKELEDYKSKDLRQRARVKWAKDGDES
ncbi:putative endonuclease/exonuclease/phosphatase [Helianthus annuus]|nr:putative endonuclease/exonuclease/phosphatase [Helianthus annuus]